MIVSFRKMLLRSWEKPNLLTLLLYPFSLVYRAVYAIRSKLYTLSVFPIYQAPVPLIVVGNLTVGGAGKTPLVIEVVTRLKRLGLKPGVISRGYGSNAQSYPLLVNKNSDHVICGDEPKLIAQRTGVPVVIGPNRRDDIELLLKDADVNIIVSDDGLQHLAMGRDIEICITDKTTNSQNHFTLPAGPYRESISRLTTTNINVLHVSPGQFEDSPSMQLVAGEVTSITKAPAATFDASSGVHAVAGIGKPCRFFSTCEELGWNIKAHAFADHHPFTEQDLAYADNLPIVMTEKDAVKCQQFAQDRLWYLPVSAKLNDSFEQQLMQELKRINAISN